MGVVATIWKVVTNHFAHVKEGIIKNSDDNANKIVDAVRDSNIAIVSALRKD